MKPVLFLWFLALSIAATLADETKPNVVLIFADDLGYGDLGCYGATKLETPNIDKLAAEGRRFTDAHSAAAVCTPSRIGLLTGTYPFRSSVWGPAPITSPLLIPTETQTIADIFKEGGYDTAVFGKWHLGFKEGKNDWQEPLRPGPQDLGFDHYFGMPVVNSAPPYVYVENDRVVGGDPDDPLVYVGRNAKNTTSITPIKPEEAQRSPNGFQGAIEAHKRFNDYQVGTLLTEKATGWIKERGDNPFFCFLSTTAVHHPFTPAPRFQGTSECGVYGDFVHELDWMVGEVRKTLEERNIADNTLVLFTSDNGGMFNLGGRVAAEKGHKINGDLLGSKFGIWEGGHRVPFIARWPGKIAPGTVSDQLLCSVDLLASFAVLTGKELTDAEKKDSINMLPALTGDPAEPLRTEMFMTPHKSTHMAIRKGKWMYIPAKSDGGFRGSKPGQHAWGGPAVTKLVGTPNSDIDLATGTFKKDAPNAQLYDLEADRNQTKNLINEHPTIARELQAELDKVRPKQTTNRTPAKKYDNFKLVGNLRYSFESGKLDGWKLVSGKLGQAVTSLPSLINRKDLPFARHGTHHLSTLTRADGRSVSDKQTGTLQSPTFKLAGDQVAFLVSGGYDEQNLYVALVDAESGDALIKAGGSKDPRMRRVVWDVSKWQGQQVHFEIVDRATGGWGHLNVDDLSVQTEGSTPGKQAAAPEDKASAVASPSPRPTTTKPNIIIIFADDLGYGDISCYHPEATQTPILDRMAKEGFRSTDFFVPANVCSPSRAALLTGRYPMRCGMPVARTEAPGSKYKHYCFDPDEITIPELLKTAGYRSLMVGKWHLGMEVDGSHPLDAGFDEHLGIPSNYGKNRGPNYNTLFRGRKVEQRNTPCEDLTKRYTDEAIAFIQRNREQPFFIYVSHHIVQTPLLPRKEFVGTSQKGKYGDFIKELDHSIARIMNTLREAGLDHNTLVIFTSDNGANRLGSNGSLNGGKYGTMEGGHRVPAIFRWPGQIPAAQVSDITLTSMDLFPLISELAGIPLPTDRKIDGKNPLNVLKGTQTTSPHNILYYYNGTNLQAIREGHWKLHLPRTVNDQPFWNKKPIGGRVFITVDESTLFNLKDDVGEKHNLANKHPEIVERIQKHATAIRAELGDVHTNGTDQRPINLVAPQER